MIDNDRLQHDKQKQMRYGTLQKRDTLILCLLKLQLMEWRFDSACKFGLGRLYPDERAVNGPNAG
ncbi:rpoE leader peptide RseD [Shigella flexneri]